MVGPSSAVMGAMRVLGAIIRLWKYRSAPSGRYNRDV
jgi:hypothetical protein